MMPALRQIVFGCAVLLGCANIAYAFDADPCFSPTRQIDQISNALSTDGWKIANRNDPKVAEHIAWMGMPQYFAGDNGGQSIEALLKMKRATAQGILKKKDLQSAKIRILSRQASGHTEVVKVAVILTQKYASVHCSFSVGAASIDIWPESQMSKASGPKFLRLKSDVPSIPDAQANKDVVAMNVVALSDALFTHPPSDAIIETYLRFLPREKTHD